MARAMPPRPPAGGRQPPRRAGGAKPPPRQQPKPPPKQQPSKPQRAGQSGKAAKQSAQTRHAAELQRRAAANAAQRQQHRLRQQQFLHEAHGQRRRGEAEQLAEEINGRVRELESILSRGLSRSARIDLDALYQSPPAAAPFDPGKLGRPTPEPAWEEFTPSGLLTSWWGGRARRERSLESAQQAYDDALEQWRVAEQDRREQLVAAERAHQLRLAEQREQVEQYNSRVARVAAGLRTREPAVVESFLRTVLRRVPLPERFPDRAEVSYRRADDWLTLRLVLPDRTVVPVLSGYDYRALGDELLPVPRPAEQIRDLYRRVLAQVSLLVLRDLFEADPGLAGITLHGLVDRLDPATGRPAFACVLRVASDRASFEALDLAGTPPQECLRTLGAEVSADPYAREPLQDPAADPA